MPDHVASYYAASAGPLRERPTLTGTLRADVCVIGAGYTGLNAALDLAARGYQVVVLDAARIGWGASGRNGGQIVGGFTPDMATIEGWVGRDDARRLWNMCREAGDILRARIDTHAIDCDLRWGYYHAALKPRHLRELAAMAEEWARYGYDGLRLVDRRHGSQALVDSPLYIGGMVDDRSGHLHPLKLAVGEARAAEAAGVRIFENSPAVRLEGTCVHTPAGCVQARRVALCANAYLGRLAPRLATKIMPVGSYIAATEPLGADLAAALIAEGRAVADCNFVLDYFRCSADHRLLFGGRAHYSGRDPDDIGAALRPRLEKVFPQLAGRRLDYGWGGMIGITLNRMPHFGRLGEGVYFAHGFSGHGVALTHLAGRLLAEAMAGDAERFDVFARLRHRDFPGGRWLRRPALVLGMLYYRLRDLL